MFELTLDKVFQPYLTGTVRTHGFEAALFGYALDGRPSTDSSQTVVALAFGESATRCKAIWGAFQQGDLLELETGDETLRCRRAPGRNMYSTYEGALPRSEGHVTALFHRAAITAYFAEPPEDHDKPFETFYTFGSPGADAPYPIWLAQLREFLLLPEQPGWAEIIWPEAVAAGLTRQLENIVGFSPVWQVLVEEARWLEIYSRLARAGQLPAPPSDDTPITYASVPLRWTLHPRRRQRVRSS